ncbi:MAG: L,D-transpeptidase family protein [Luteolibacter sp.]
MKRFLPYLAITVLLVLAAVIFMKWRHSLAIPRVVEGMDLPGDCSQAIVVTSTSWEATEGKLTLLEKSSGTEWHEVLEEPIPVMLGRSGMGWGRGLPLSPASSGTAKREGDGRAVAGIFRLGTAFGYAPAPPEGTKLTYRPAGEHDYFVDDSTSPLYNQWVNLPPENGTPESLWKSAERMRLDDGRYELGIVVEHNMHPAVPEMGSAIFLHIWGAPGTPTSGCTAMSRSDMEKVMKWLDPARKPLLIQAPEDLLHEMRLNGGAE